jgi:hypothetical protein
MAQPYNQLQLWVWGKGQCKMLVGEKVVCLRRTITWRKPAKYCTLLPFMAKSSHQLRLCWRYFQWGRGKRDRREKGEVDIVKESKT